MKIHHRGLLQRLASPILKTLGIIAALYLFVCSLTFLSTAFRILGGRNLSNLFQNSEILSNPIVGIMIGILVTVAVQSSATSTSIIVALVSAGAPVKNTIPMIFGSNVGTSVTNNIDKKTKIKKQWIKVFWVQVCLFFNQNNLLTLYDCDIFIKLGGFKMIKNVI